MKQGRGQDLKTAFFNFRSCPDKNPIFDSAKLVDLLTGLMVRQQVKETESKASWLLQCPGVSCAALFPSVAVHVRCQNLLLLSRIAAALGH